MVVAAVMALAILSGQATPQSTPGNAAVAVPDIEVTAPSRRAIQSFVDVVADPGERGPNRGQIARWNDHICVRVIGGAYADNVRLTEAVKAVYVSLDRRVARPRCQPNVMVVVADNAPGFARVFANRYSNRFFRQHRQPQEAFATATTPVRWEHRTQVEASGRQPMIDAGTLPSGQSSVGLANSRITQSTAERIDRAMIVLDARQIDVVPIESLAAYVAFVSLVNMPIDAPAPGRPSILSLFDKDRQEPLEPGLTEWDRAFLDSLYTIPTDQLFAFQRQELTLRMASKLNATD
ncbi:MAG: hypothetical protein JWR59_950 [Brevundimonas sp.]|nr:hypothetical protein [Brevundimonas sp.]